MSEEVKSPTISKKSFRFGWKDFSLNLVFSLIMLVSIYIFVFFYNPPQDIIDWVVRLFVTVIPFLLFSYRMLFEFMYGRDFIEITDDILRYRSTPLLLTGFRIKRGEIQLREIRKYALAKIPRKFSLDLRKIKNKAMLVISLKNGKEHFIGEYFENDDLAEICMYIKQIYPKAKLQTNLAADYPELAKKEKSIAKKLKQLDDEEEPEGVNIRGRNR